MESNYTLRDVARPLAIVMQSIVNPNVDMMRHSNEYVRRSSTRLTSILQICLIHGGFLLLRHMRRPMAALAGEGRSPRSGDFGYGGSRGPQRCDQPGREAEERMNTYILTRPLLPAYYIR
jgi:hypothetical protein